MKKTIEIPIECRVPNPAGVDYEELGIEEPEGQLTFRLSTLFISHIVGLIPDSENNGCLIYLSQGDSLYTNMKYRELRELLINYL